MQTYWILSTQHCGPTTPLAVWPIQVIYLCYSANPLPLSEPRYNSAFMADLYTINHGQTRGNTTLDIMEIPPFTIHNRHQSINLTSISVWVIWAFRQTALLAISLAINTTPSIQPMLTRQPVALERG